MKSFREIFLLVILLLATQGYAGGSEETNKAAIEDAKQAEKYLGIAIRENNQTALNASFQFIDKALSQNRENLQIQQLYYMIGFIMLNQSKNPDIAKKLKSLFPNLYRMNANPAPPSYLDMLMLTEDKEQERIKLLKKAMKENPKYADVYMVLSEDYLKKENYDLAIDTLQRGLKNTGEREVIFHYQLALAYMYQSYYLDEKMLCITDNKSLTKSIIKEAKATLKLNPGITDMYGLLAVSYARLGQNTLAVDAATKSYQKGNSKETLFMYEKALIENGEKEIYFKMLTEGKTSGDLDNLSQAYFMNQDWGKASEIYKKMIDTKDESVYFYTYLKYAITASLSKNDNGKEIKNILETIPGKMIKNIWQKMLVDFYSDKIGEKAFVESADTPCKRTEAYFWLAMKNLIEGTKEKAVEFFQKVLNEKVYSYVEYGASKYYLKDGIK